MLNTINRTKSKIVHYPATQYLGFEISKTNKPIVSLIYASGVISYESDKLPPSVEKNLLDAMGLTTDSENHTNLHVVENGHFEPHDG